MTQQHPITPPQELRDKWLDKAPNTSVYDYLIDSAAQWGADQELEACCEWIAAYPWLDHPELLIKQLRAARRPKPPSLKEQALEAMHRNWNPHNNDDFDTIRRALEQLDD
jgi:hypothetical protein